MNKAIRQAAATEIARNALVGVSDAPGLRTTRREDLQAVADAITTQDPWWTSKRVHASIAAGAAVLLGLFGAEIDEGRITETLSAAAAVAAIVLPLLSKRADARATRARPAKGR